MEDKIKDVSTSVTNLIAVLKGLAKYLLIPTGIIVFAPDNILNHFRMLDLKNSFGVWVAVLFWISFSFMFFDLSEKIIKFFISKRKQRKMCRKQQEKIEKQKKILNDLNGEERYFVYHLYMNGSAVIHHDIDFIENLTLKDIIKSSSLGRGNGTFSYSLQH